MRSPVIALVAAGGLVLVTVTALSAQTFPPVVPRVLAPPAIAPAAAPAAPIAESPEATVRRHLAGRGLDRDVVDGPMLARAPGEATASDFVVDPEMDALLGELQPEAWLVWTTAGRWWYWDYGVIAPADQRALVAETHARRQASAEGRVLD
jgi:hypothetical protein